MDKVPLEREVLAVERVLARRMEVELLELELAPVDDQRAARRVVDLDRVAVVDDVAGGVAL